MRKSLQALAAVLAFVPAVAAHATSYVARTIEVSPAGFSTLAQGITTAGVLAGTYRNGPSASARYGFVREPNGVTATVNHPSAAAGTELLSINDRLEAVGNYAAGGVSRAFVYRNGAFTALTPPNAARGTVAAGINNMGSVIGEYIDAAGSTHSFVNKGTDYFPIVHPKAVVGTTRVTGINNAGWQSGYYHDATGTHGFLRAGSIYTTIDHPDADSSGTIATGVNSSAAVVGYYRNTSGTHGFVYAGGVFSPLDVTNARATYPTGINDNGVVTGYYFDGTVSRGFVATPQRVAGRARDFTANIGVNTHIDYVNRTFDSWDAVVQALQYLKVRLVRDSPAVASQQSWGYIAQRTGVKFNAYIPSGSASHMQGALDLMPGLANAGLLNSIEGPNEEDNPFPASMGTTIQSAAQFQSKVFQVGRSLRLPVINLSFGSGWSEANNWAGNYDKVGDLSAICDFANGHTFPEPNVGEPGATVQMIFRNAHIAAPGKPMIHSEIGWDYRTPEADVPTVLLQGVLDAMQDGAVRAYIYALFDETDGHTFGIMNGDGSPKPEGIALRNMMTLLDDAGDGAGTFSPTALGYRITKTSGGDRTYLLQKSDGTFWIAVWNELLQRHDVTVTLDASAAKVQVFNPVASAAPVQSLANVSAVSFSMAGAPILISVAPASGASAPPPPNTITSDADNAVINANPGTTAVTLYGTGNTVNGSTGSFTVAAFQGGNTFNTSGGTATVYMSGPGNRLNFGSGLASIRDSGTNSTYVFGLPGSGNIDVYGYIFSQGATLDLRNLLAGTQWTGTSSTLASYLKVTTVGSDAVLNVNASGLPTGAIYPVAIFHGYEHMNLSALLQHAAF